MKKICSYSDDIKVTNALKAYRKSIKGAQMPRHILPWPKAYLAAMVFLSPNGKRNGVTIDDLRSLLNKIGLTYSSPAASFLAKCVEKFMPSAAREYSNELPDLVTAMTLDYDRVFNQQTGEWEWRFWFKRTSYARQLLITKWPEVCPLINILAGERIVRNRK